MLIQIVNGLYNILMNTRYYMDELLNLIIRYWLPRLLSEMMLHIHTFPDPEPIATVLADTAEHDGRYSEGSHKMFSELNVIQALSELRPTFSYTGTWKFVPVEVVDGINESRAI